MKSTFFVLIGAFFLFSGFTDNQIWVRAKMPFSVFAGDRFTVEITINKLDLQQFAEFKQTLPAGFNAIQKEPGKADFSFKNQVVKFTWIRLPREPRITISYDILIGENIKGQFKLPGEFVYIYKNQRGTAVLANDVINVSAKGEAIINTISPDNENNVYFPPKNPQKIQCIRIKPTLTQSQDAYIVRLLISRSNILGRLKIEEIIPEGYTVSIIDIQKATFAIDKKRVEFNWSKMPDQRDFEIRYRLTPKARNMLPPVLSGQMVYFSGGQQFFIPVIELAPEKLNPPDNQRTNSPIHDFFRN
jgi:hypothetical protein